jgi:hypothetical protein
LVVKNILLFVLVDCSHLFVPCQVNVHPHVDVDHVDVGHCDVAPRRRLHLVLLHEYFLVE